VSLGTLWIIPETIFLVNIVADAEHPAFSISTNITRLLL